MKNLIYIVEDDYAIRNLVVYALEKENYTVKAFEDSKNIIQNIQKDMPNLIVLDIMLPSENGLSILHKIKNAKKIGTIPVILLTAKNLEYDKIKGLDLGADDYITKPFSVMEFLARVRAVIRRTKATAPQEEGNLSFKGIELRLTERTVTVDKKEVNLTYTEFEFLKFFINNLNTVVSREKLLSIVWGYDYEGESRTVDVHINNLRNKIGEYNVHLKTVRGIGYKFGE